MSTSISYNNSQQILTLKSSIPIHFFNIKSKYFKNNSTLIDELSFCCYYHYSPISIFTHLFSFLSIVFIAYGYICKIQTIIGPIIAIVAAFLYSGVLFFIYHLLLN